MSFIGVVIMAGAIATCFVLGIVGGVLLVLAAPLRRRRGPCQPGPRHPGPRQPGSHRDGPPPWPRRRG
jgi:hypothetical protein